MADVVLRPGNDRDFETSDLEALAGAVRDDTGLDVEVASREQRGYAVTWWEVVDFLLTDGAGHAIDAIIGVAVAWARKRLRAAKEKTDRPRPVAVRIYGPDGELLKTVEVTDPDADPKIKDGD
jgi:hypothetical protein